jgi:hypothetical protein
MSDAAFSLVIRLLAKNPEERLGNHPSDFATIRQAKFFQTIDWKQVKKRCVSSNLELILDSPLNIKGRPRRTGLDITSEISSEVAGGPVMEQDVEEDCSYGSLWLDNFTQGGITQPPTGC